MKFKARRELKRTKIEVIPMIDTMFFLLVFFMLSSLALTKMNGLRVNLPQTQTMPPEAPSKLTLTITSDEKLYLNSKEVSEDALTSKLSDELSTTNSNPAGAVFIINADESVRHGLVMRCIDKSRSAGITHYAIATAGVSAKP